MPGVWRQCSDGFQESSGGWNLPCPCSGACVCFHLVAICTLKLISISSQLCQWLWPKLLRKLAEEFMEARNAFRSQLDCSKPGPSSMSCNEAYSLPHKWGGRQCLLNVDIGVISEIKEFMSDGKDVFHFPLIL